jgi:HK97 family phage portal protein
MNRIQKLANTIRSRVGWFNPETIATEMGIFPMSTAGVSVNENTAMSIATVYACTYRIASTIASLGVRVFERNGNEVQPLPNHPTNLLISQTPNPEQTAFEFWETFIAMAVVNGLAFAHIERGANGRPTALRLVHRSDVDEKISGDGELIYHIRGFGNVLPENMLVVGNMHRKSPIQVHAENLGLSLAAQNFGANYFANGGQLTGVLSSEQPMTNEQREKLVELYRRETSHGPKTILLPFGVRHQRIAITADEAQFIQTRKLGNREICTIFSMPPSMVGVDADVTYSNVEQQQIMFRNHTIIPWVRRIESEINRKLIFSFERPETYVLHDLAELTRGDLKTRGEYFQTMLQNGVMNRNEVRAHENMNPIDGMGGEIRTVQVNQIDLEAMEDFSRKMADQSIQ